MKVAQSKLLNQGSKTDVVSSSTMTAGEKQSIASFKDFCDGMLKSVHKKMLLHLEQIYCP